MLKKRGTSNDGEDDPANIPEPGPEVIEGSGFDIVARQDFSDVTYLIEFHHPMMAKAARPGQFVIVIAHEHGERIPLTIADFDPHRGTNTLVIQAAVWRQVCRRAFGLAAVGNDSTQRNPTLSS